MINIWELQCHSCDIIMVAYTSTAHKKFYKEHAEKGHLYSDSIETLMKGYSTPKNNTLEGDLDY